MSDAQQQYVSAAQLAGLPGMPASVFGVIKRSKREAWESRQRAGRGGGREYSVGALPAETRAALAARLDTEAARAGRHEGRKAMLSGSIAEEAAFNRRLSGLKTSLHQPISGQRRIDAKLQILSAFERFHRASHLAVRVARPDFARRYNAGEVEVEPWVRDQLPSVSDASLWRWQRQIKSSGVSALAGNYGNRKGESIVDSQPALYEFAVSMLVSHPHCSTAHLMQGIRARFNGHNAIDYPSARALQRWVTNWKRANKQTFTAIMNPDQWKSSHMAAFGSQSADLVRVNQRWELDSTPGDIMLTDGRHAVIGVIDVYSRRVKLIVSKTSKATAIATLLRHALLEWGVPEEAKTDNGADYTSNHIVRVFRSLEIEHTLCPPFQPWHKPHIERFFRTFSHGLVELLPGFIGHNVAERQAIEARTAFAERLMQRVAAIEVSLSAAEFQKFCDDWCQDVYLHQPHKGLAGKSPFEVLAASRDAIRSIPDPRALDILLAEAPANNGRRTVQKKGIELDHAWFIAPELGERVGDEVYVRFDPADLGRIYVFDGEDGFICVAECPERTGMDRKLVAAKAREIQKARVQDERRAFKHAARRVGTDDIVQEILTDRAEAAGKLTRLPAPANAHHTHALASASRAARGRRAPEPARLTDEEREAQAALERELAEGTQARRVLPIDSPEINYRRWNRIDAQLAAGAIVDDGDREWHRSYRGSAEWRSMEKLAEDYPDLKQA